VPRLSPDELAEARRRSGRLGGRPRKPSVEEARAKALEELVPRAIRVLREALDSGRDDAWRPALRVLEHCWGRPADQVEMKAETRVEELSLDQLRALRARLLAAHPELARLTVVE
jgi:hypothetical protein